MWTIWRACDRPRFKAALSRAIDGEAVTVNITQDDRVNEDYFLVEPIDFTYTDGQLLVTLEFHYRSLRR